MRIKQSLESTLHDICMMVAVIAFLFRALVPVGFMPVFAGIDGTQIVICAGASEKVITVDADGKPIEKQHHKDGNNICGFAANTGGTLPLPTQAVLPASAILVVESIGAGYIAPNAYNNQPNPSRAPPSA